MNDDAGVLTGARAAPAVGVPPVPAGPLAFEVFVTAASELFATGWTWRP